MFVTLPTNFKVKFVLDNFLYAFFTFYVDDIFPLSVPRLLPDFTVYKSKTTGTAYLSRAHAFSRVFLCGIARLFSLLCCPSMCRVFTF